MALLRAIITALVLSTTAAALAAFPPHGNVLPVAPPPATVALTRTILQPTATTTPPLAFRMLGQPFQRGEMPGTGSVTATLAGSLVRVAECDMGGPMLYTDGSARWARLLIDYSGQNIVPSNTTGSLLQFAPSAIPWSNTSHRSDADWESLNDSVKMTGLTTTIAGLTGTTGTGYTLPGGTWTATFDSTATIIHICSSPLGNLVVVEAPFKNGSTLHVEAVAVMEYWITEKADTTLGPIYSRGPLILNTFLTAPVPGGSGITCNGSTICPTSFEATFSWKRGGGCPRTYNTAAAPCDWPNVAVWAMTGAVMVRPDGDWDCWISGAACTTSDADNTAAWVWEDYTKVRATRAIQPFADGIPTVYNPALAVGTNSGIDNPTSSVTGYNSSTGIFTVGDKFAISPGTGGGTNFFPGPAIEFNTVGSMGGITAKTPYYICWPNGSATTQIAIYGNPVDTLACGATGQIIPTGSLPGGMVAQLSIAPEFTGRNNVAQGDTGSRSDLFVLPEWCVAYLVSPITAIGGSNWSAQVARRFCRVNAWSEWAIPQHVMNYATGAIISALDQTTTNTFSTNPNMGGGSGLGTSQTNIEYANAVVYPGTINGGNGPTAGFGVYGGGRYACQVTGPSLCGDVNRQHAPGNAPYLVWLLEGDALLQLDIQMAGTRGLSDNAPNQVTYNSVTYYGQWMIGNDCTRCVSHAAWDIPLAEYSAPEGSAEQAYWRADLAANVTNVNAFMATMPANYQAIWPLGYNPGQWGTVHPGNPDSTWQTFQQAYIQWGMAQFLNAGEYTSGLNTVIQKGLTMPLYVTGVGLGGATGATPCTYWVDFYEMSFNTSDTTAAFPGTYISDLSQMALLPTDTSVNTLISNTTFSNGSAALADYAPSGPWVFDVTGGTGQNGPKNGDFVRFQDWGVSAPVVAAPSPFVDGTNYCVVNTPSPNNASMQLASSCGGAAITSGGTISAPPTPQAMWIPGPGWSCPASGTTHSGSSNSDSYLMYMLQMTGQAAAAQNAGLISPTYSATTAYSNMKARLGVGIPGQCQSAANCMGDHW